MANAKKLFKKFPEPTEDQKVFRQSRNLSDAGQRVRDALYPKEKKTMKPVKENTQPPIKPSVPLPPVSASDEDQEKKKGAQTGTGFLKRTDKAPPSKYNKPKSTFKPFWLESPAKTIVATMLEDEYPGIGLPPEPLASGNVDADEFDIGRDFEMQKAGGDPTRAEAIALSNLAKDSRYYTNLLAGRAVPPAKTYMAGDSMGTAGSSSGGM